VLPEFLTMNRTALIDRCRQKVARRISPRASVADPGQGIPLFLDQLVRTLREEQTSAPDRSHEPSEKAAGERLGSTEIGASAARHGRELLEHGFTVDQVVHDYGDLCQAVTELAVESSTPIQANEFGILNRCLDNAIADAVTEFSHQYNSLAADRGVHAWREHLGFLAREIRDHINTATIAVAAIRSGSVGVAGPTADALDRSLVGMKHLIDRCLADVRVSAGMPPQRQLVRLADFVADVKVSASLEALGRGCKLTVADIGKDLMVDVDRDMLLSAVVNLLQNAFKFTKPRTEVSLTVYRVADRILIDILDHCGGLPPGSPEEMFLSFSQSGPDRSGLGLGLSISRRGVEANDGVLRVRDVPGSGCVFTIDLPRYTLPQSPSP